MLLRLSCRLPMSRPKVLVVEDNALQPGRGTRMVRRMASRVGIASGLLDGLKLLCKRQFALVLIDMQKAGLAGEEGVRRFRHGRDDARRFVSASDTPVIAFSTPGLAGDEGRVRELGFDDHIFKPIRRGQMLAMLSKHLHAPAATESTDSPANGRVDATARPAGDARAGLDAAALGRLTELDPTGANRLLERVLQAFQGSVARLRPQLEAASRSGDLAAVRLVVHTLKSSSASIGALRLSQLCAQIETAIRLDTGEELSAPLAALNDALDSALQAIDALLRERA